jgi:hypothetical protein
MQKMIKVSVLALSIGLVGGCGGLETTTTGGSDAPEMSAMERANDAYNLAQTAHSLASEAAYAADQAQRDAQAALQCCNENASKLDRMFEKAMTK